MSISIHIRKKLASFTLEVNVDINDDNFALLGASGSGKSMLLKCIAGIETPDEGRIVINDKVVFDAKANINVPIQERECGFVFQNYALFPNMTVKENITCGIKEKRNRRKIVEQLLKQYDLEEIQHHYPAYLSGGQQQRCAIARAMASNPSILLFDEPFSALDKPLKQKLLQELKVVLRSFSGTTIFVSHDHEEVYLLADYVGIIERGNLVEVNDKERIYHTPQYVSSAKQVGIENISSIKKIDKHTVYAKDWDMILTTKEEVEAYHTHIGIRQVPIQQTIQTENTYTVEVIDNIQQIHGEYAMVKKKGRDANSIICRKECVMNDTIQLPNTCLFLMRSKLW